MNVIYIYICVNHLESKHISDYLFTDVLYFISVNIMTALPYLYLPYPRIDCPLFGLDFPHDQYRIIYNAQGSTLSLIKRTCNESAEIDILELTFRATIDSFKAAKDMLSLAYIQYDCRVSLHDNLAQELFIPIIRTEIKKGNNQFIVEFDRGYMIACVHHNDEDIVIIRLTPTHQNIRDIRSEWLWKFGNLLRRNRPLTRQNVFAFKTSPLSEI
jgi:hypothetical protein